MNRLTKWARKAIPACALAAAGLAPLSANAVVQLGFILDASGSISAPDWTTITAGLGNAVKTLVPTDGSYEINLVTFSSTASIALNGVVVTAANRDAIGNFIIGLSQSGGSTNYSAAFLTMQNALNDGTGITAAQATASYVNFATDGLPNTDTGNTQIRRDALVGAGGVDNLSIEGIGVGASGAAFLQNNICYPGPCDNTVPFNFPAQGFYIGVDTAAEYAAAIANKIRIVTGQTPEPATLALVGAALAMVGLSRRRRGQVQA